MASISKNTSKKTGKTTWRVHFRKRVYGKDRKVKKNLCRSIMFLSREEAESYVQEYEHVFFLNERGDPAYDRLMEDMEKSAKSRLMEKMERRFSQKIKDKI